MKGVELGGRLIEEPSDILDVAKALQEYVAALPRDRAQVVTAANGIDEILGDPRLLYGTKNIALMALHALVVRDYSVTCSDDELLFEDLNLTNVTVRGSFSRFAFVRTPTVNSLTLQLFEAKILAANEREYVGVGIRSGMHVPVMAVSSAFPLT